MQFYRDNLLDVLIGKESLEGNEEESMGPSGGRMFRKKEEQV